jgi:hypothetical protein
MRTGATWTGTVSIPITNDAAFSPTYPFQRQQYRVGAPPATPSTDGWLYEIQWQRQDLLKDPEPLKPTPHGRWMILADRSGAGGALAALLEERGESCDLVLAGAGYERQAANRWTVNAESR